jgi:G3E family GTPase
VAQTFFVDETVRDRTRLDAIVTVVDAKNVAARLADSHEAADQIAFADVIVLNKTDLATPDELAATEASLRRINPYAAIHRAARGDVPVDQLLDRGAFDLARILDMRPDFLEDDAHEHGDDVVSMSFEAARPLDPERFNAWISALLAEQGQNLLRTKGILAYAGDERRFAFQAVHMIADGDYVGKWKDGDPRRSRIVFIGRSLNRPQLRRGFESCQIPA